MPETETRNGDTVARFMEEWARVRPDLDPRPVGIFGRLYRISARLVRRSDRYLTPLGLNWETFSMVVTLRRAGEPFELRPRDILNEGLLTSGAVTNRIDRVEALGLVERRPDPSDRRSVIVRLTPAGKQLADKAIEQHFDALDEVFDVLDASEHAQLAGLLSKLLGALEARSLAEENARAARKIAS